MPTINEIKILAVDIVGIITLSLGALWLFGMLMMSIFDHYKRVHGFIFVQKCVNHYRKEHMGMSELPKIKD